MNNTELKEAAALLKSALDILLTVALGSESGANLRLACGDLSARAAAAIKSGVLGTDLLACFDAAYDAGATINSMGRVRAAIGDLTATGWPAIAVKTACLRLAMVEESKCLAAATFVSRTDVENYVGRVNGVFGSVEDYAADQRDIQTYRALVALHTAVVKDLATRGRPLPRIVSYAYQTAKPALWIANRLYGDGGRAEELIAENKMVHPLFAPMTGRAFSQ
jgi:hypothetical protein